MEESTLTAKGQTTIPKSIRDQLGLKPGAKIRYFVAADGRVSMLPVIPITQLRGLLKSDGPPVSVEAMNEAIAAAAAGEPER